MCPTVQFKAVIDGKNTNMLAAVAPKSMLPYPAIVGRNGSGLHIQWDVTVTETAEDVPTTSGEQQKAKEAAAKCWRREPWIQHLLLSHHQSRKAMIKRALQGAHPCSRLLTTNQHLLAEPTQRELAPLNLENLTDMDILAVQTRAQKKRQQQADEAATLQSGAKITPLYYMMSNHPV